MCIYEILFIFYNSLGKRCKNLFIFLYLFPRRLGHCSAWSPPLYWITHFTVPQSVGMKYKSCLETCLAHCLVLPSCAPISGRDLAAFKLRLLCYFHHHKGNQQEVSLLSLLLCFLPRWQRAHKSAKEPWASATFHTTSPSC